MIGEDCGCTISRVASFHAEPQRGVPGGMARTWIGRPPLTDGQMIAAAEKAQPAVIEIVALEIVDRRRLTSGADERIDLVLDEEAGTPNRPA